MQAKATKTTAPQAKAILRGVRISPQKARLVADQVRGLPVGRATNLLAFSDKRAAQLLKKVLLSAVANAENNLGADVDELKIATIMVDEGPRLNACTHVRKAAARRLSSVRATSLWLLAPKDTDDGS